MKTIKHITSAIMVLICLGCGGDNNGSDNAPTTPTPSPLAATLIFPDNNETCNEGNIISDTESNVTFRWSNAELTDSYVVNLTNLNTNISKTIASTSNEKSITLERGTPYKWSVTSLADGTNTTAKSEEWKFYNAGSQEENHAPFPAEAITPKTGSSVNAGAVLIKWNSNDVDNDIASYDIFLDVKSPPTVLVATQTSNSITREVIGGQVYYWQIITKDKIGNSSQSQIFEFKVN